jgi:two-component system OmpR family sensor kinase
MRWFRRLSIRWRITIGSVTVAALLLTGAAVAFRMQIEQVQINADKKLLYDATTPYLTEIKAHPSQIDPPGGEQHLAVIDPSGRSVVSNLPDALSDRVGDLTRLGDGSHFISEAGANYLVVVRTVAREDGDWHVVATRDERLTAAVMTNVTNVLVIGAALLLTGFGIASWLLTTAALRPVTQMRQRADTLRITDSAEPLPVGPADDELAALAVTLNAFISSVRDTAAREKQMVSDASHELRTPIAALKAHLELAHLSEGNAEALKADLERAEDAVDRLARLATNLLVLSALEAGAEVESATWDALVIEFGDASDRARLLALEKNTTIEFDVVDRGDDTTYRVSTTNFGRVIDNLVSNALRSVPVAGVVHVQLAQEPGFIRFTVDDSGPGMPEDFIAIAFDRFTRPDTQRGDALGGSGLGLSIVAAIAAAGGGDVRLENRPGGGFRVTVTIAQTSHADESPE